MIRSDILAEGPVFITPSSAWLMEGVGQKQKEQAQAQAQAQAQEKSKDKEESKNKIKRVKHQLGF